MSRPIVALADWVRGRPVLRACARVSVRLIPDLRWTRRFPEIGPIRFRLRRQRWYLWEEFACNDHFMLGVFDRLVRRGDVVYDVGANIGIYTRMLVQWFGASAVVAFEPMSDNVELLRANVSLGGLDERVRVLPIAVGEVDGEEALQVDDVRSSTAVLDRVSGGAPSAGRQRVDLPPRTERVTVARLDRVVAEKGLPPPAVIKIDTEGAEALVIEGARETLRRHRPRLAVATHGPDKAEATIAALAGLGYHVWGFRREGAEETGAWRRLEIGDGPRLANNNLIAADDETLGREPLRPKRPEDLAGRGEGS